MSKDWIGGKSSALTTNGARNYAKQERETHDFYATDPKAVKLLLEQETFNQNIWEVACGTGHISEELKNHGYTVKSTDLINRGYEDETLNFLEYSGRKYDGDIITNPPYKYASEFVIKAMEVAMFLKLTFLESQKRKPLFKQYPPKYLYVSRGRIGCAKNGEFEKSSQSAIAYAWYVWEKGSTSEPIIRWIN